MAAPLPLAIRLLQSLGRIACQEIFKLSAVEESRSIDFSEVGDVLDLYSPGSYAYLKQIAEKFGTSKAECTIDEIYEIIAQALCADGYFELKNMLSLKYRRVAELGASVSDDSQVLAAELPETDGLMMSMEISADLEHDLQLAPDITLVAFANGAAAACSLESCWELQGKTVLRLIGADADRPEEDAEKSKPQALLDLPGEHAHISEAVARANLCVVLVLTPRCLECSLVLAVLETIRRGGLRYLLVHDAASGPLPDPCEAPSRLRLLLDAPVVPFWEQYGALDAAEALAAMEGARTRPERRLLSGTPVPAHLAVRGLARRVLISHDGDDSAYQAHRIASELSCGYRARLSKAPEQCEPAAVRAAEVVLVFMSAGYLEAPACCSELDLAVATRRRIILVTDYNCDISPEDDACAGLAARTRTAVAELWHTRVVFSLGHLQRDMMRLRQALGFTDTLLLQLPHLAVSGGAHSGAGATWRSLVSLDLQVATGGGQPLQLSEADVLGALRTLGNPTPADGARPFALADLRVLGCSLTPQLVGALGAAVTTATALTRLSLGVEQPPHPLSADELRPLEAAVACSTSMRSLTWACERCGGGGEPGPTDDSGSPGDPGPSAQCRDLPLKVLLGAAVANSRLTELDLDVGGASPGLDAVAPTLVALLRASPELAALTLRRGAAGSPGAMDLLSAIGCCRALVRLSLQHMDLQGGDCMQTMGRNLAALSAGLRDLEIRDCGLSTSDVDLLCAGLMMNRGLHTLRLTAGALRGGSQPACVLRSSTSLQVLDISAATLKEGLLEDLAAVLPQSRLQRLLAGGASGNVAGLPALAAAMRAAAALREVVFPRDLLPPDAVQALAESLGAATCGLSSLGFALDVGAADERCWGALVDALASSSALHTLEVTLGGATEGSTAAPGVQALCAGVRANSSLRDLRIGACEGAARLDVRGLLVAAMQQQHITRITLSGFAPSGSLWRQLGEAVASADCCLEALDVGGCVLLVVDTPAEEGLTTGLSDFFSGLERNESLLEVGLHSVQVARCSAVGQVAAIAKRLTQVRMDGTLGHVDASSVPVAALLDALSPGVGQAGGGCRITMQLPRSADKTPA